MVQSKLSVILSEACRVCKYLPRFAPTRLTSKARAVAVNSDAVYYKDAATLEALIHPMGVRLPLMHTPVHGSSFYMNTATQGRPRTPPPPPLTKACIDMSACHDMSAYTDACENG